MEQIDHQQASRAEGTSLEMARLYEKFGLRRCVGLDFPPVYRCRELTDATREDIEACAALGIFRVYDLRKGAERSMTPEPEIVCNAFEVVSCPVDLQNDESRTHTTIAHDVKAAYGKPGERMIDLYTVMASHADAIKAIVESIVAAKEPVLVHCANGKDRVGVVCASVQLLLGVANSCVLEDYLATNNCNDEMNRRDLRRYAGIMQPEEVAVLAAMFEARAVYLETFFSEVSRRHGSIRSWLS